MLDAPQDSSGDQDDPRILAAVSLLDDDSSQVVDSCRRRLLRFGERGRPALVGAARDAASPRLRLAARRTLRSLDLRAWTRAVEDLGARLAAERAKARVLDEGVGLILSFDRLPGARAAVEERVVQMADALRPLVEGRNSANATARQLGAYLGGAQGFRGCTRDFYRRENLFLDQAIERRRGLSIALTTLYLLVGRRVGLDMSAVRLQDDYYLVRVKGRRNVLLDPFHAGRSVTKLDCLRYLRTVGDGVKPSSSCLRDVDDVDLLLGTMSTLERIDGRREDREFREALRQAQRSLSLL